jgi:hypothetical protein
MIGAGASLSSNAPSTQEIEDALWQEFEHEFTGGRAELREGLDLVTRDQVEQLILPMFDDVKPYIGYLAVAALARRIRVLIVNLNWDEGVEKAAAELGMEDACASLSLDEGVDAIRAALGDASKRIVNLHVHGRLDRDHIRFARSHTLMFKDEEMKLLCNEFFRHPTAVVGASLKGEYDVTGLLAEASSGSGPKTPFWLFSRQRERTARPDDQAALDLLARHSSFTNFAGDPYVDFDRLMVELLAARSERPLAALFEEGGLRFPDPENLVFPAPDLLRDHLHGPPRGRGLAFVGERKVGKSTTARLVAHWAGLLTEQPSNVVARFGFADCRRGIEELVAGRAPDSAGDVVVFDNPYGDGGQYQPNPKFTEAFAKAVGDPECPRILITSSPSNWRRALRDDPALSDLAEVVCAQPRKWYRGLDLAALADDPTSKSPAMVTRRVLEGVASTPKRVDAATDGVLADSEPEVVEEKLALLNDLDLEAQQFLTLVRFHELSASIAPQGELLKRLKDPAYADTVSATRHMLEEEAFDGLTYVRFAHHTDREAFDRLYEARRDDLLPEVKRVAELPSLIPQVCKVWSVIVAVRGGQIEAVDDLDTGERLEWGPLLLEEAAASEPARERLPELLTKLSRMKPHDFWSLRELVYEVARLWPELHKSKEAQAFIADVLTDDTRMGRYCLLEALLYFQEATHSQAWERDRMVTELWDAIRRATWTLTNDPKHHGFEIALMFDAIAWYAPPLRRESLLLWVEQLVEASDVRPDLVGAFAMTCLYHAEGRALFEELRLDSPLGSPLANRQVRAAAAMVRWHYVHQARGRALLTRRRLEPAKPDLLRRAGQTRRLDGVESQAIERFITRMVAAKEHAGWAVHLAINLRWTAGRYEDAFIGRCIERDVGDEDDGLITAAITYQIPDAALDQMRAYFARDDNRRALLKRMRDGYPAPGPGRTQVKVAPPRFIAARTPHDVHHQLDTRWPSLAANDLDPSHDRNFVREVNDRIAKAVSADVVPIKAARELRRRVVAGDYSDLEEAKLQAEGDAPTRNWVRRKDPLTKLAVNAVLAIDDQDIR